MAVSDQVLGTHLDLEGVEEGARTGARRLWAATTTNDTDLSARHRLALVEQLARLPGIQLALACENDELARYLVIGQGGRVRVVELVDSRSAEVLDPPQGSIRPPARVRGDVETAIHRLHDAGAMDPLSDLGEGVIAFPYQWREKTALVRALVELAPMFGELPPFIAGIGGKRYDIVPGDGFFDWSPLFLFAPEGGPGYGEAYFDLAQLALPQPRDRERISTRAGAPSSAAPPMRDPGRPYTTGTVDQRRASIAAAVTAKTRDFGSLIAALQDPANADPHYDQVRRDLYRYLANHDTREIAGLFLWALQEETDGLIETVAQLAWRQTRLRAALPDLIESAESRGDRRTAYRMRAALDAAEA